jgi:hypothetical protein
MALHAGLSDAASNRIVQLLGNDQVMRTATAPCLVCGRPATWRIERPDGSYLLCEWCDSIIREYDSRHPERDPSRHLRLGWDEARPGIERSAVLARGRSLGASVITHA